MDHLFEAFSWAFLLTIVRYFTIAGLFFLVFYLLFPKSLLRNKIQSRLAGKADFLREILHSSISSFVLAITAILSLSEALRPYTLIYTGIHDYPLIWIPVSLLLTLAVHDTYFYWMHRILHHKKLFKLTHLVHHKSTNPSPWTSYSFNFLEAIAEGGVMLVLVVVMPLHPLTLGLFAFSSFVINVYGHLGYEIMPKWFRKSFLFEIINTSTFHNFHHLKFKGNYGLYLRVWDRLMNTEHPDYVKEYDRMQKQRFG
jgi:Sterol desaturase